MDLIKILGKGTSEDCGRCHLDAERCGMPCSFIIDTYYYHHYYMTREEVREYVKALWPLRHTSRRAKFEVRDLLKELRRQDESRSS